MLNLLDQAIKQVCPIDGVSVGNKDDKSTWRIDFKYEATQAEKDAAQLIVDNFDINAKDPDQYQCTNWQMIQALDESNMLSSVESYINDVNTPLLVKKGYLHAGTFKLADTWMQTAITALGLTEAQAIGLFQLAMSK